MNLKRNSDGKLESGEYLAKNDERIWCIWKCPKCGKLANISKRVHAVDLFGVITPEVKCPNEQCYHVDSYALEDWIPTAKGSA